MEDIQQALPRRVRSLRKNAAGCLFVLPLFLGMMLIVFGPLGTVVVNSVQRIDALGGTSTFAGLANYRRLLEDPDFAGAVRNSVLFVVLFVPLNTGAALLLATLVNVPLRLRYVYRSIFFLPFVTSLVAWSVIWTLVLQKDGGLNAVLGLFSVDGPNWLHEVGWAMIAIVLVVLLKNVGLGMILFMAALQTVPIELLEAATLDGAGRIARFRRIVLPVVGPTVFLVMSISTIGAFQVFDTIRIMTEGGPEKSTSMLAWYVYVQGFRSYDLGYASAVAVALFLLILAITSGLWIVRRRLVYQEAD